MVSNLPSPAVDQRFLPETFPRLNVTMSLVCPGGILGSPLTESTALTGAAPWASPIIKFPLPSLAPDLEYLDQLLRLFLFTLSLFPET